MVKNNLSLKNILISRTLLPVLLGAILFAIFECSVRYFYKKELSGVRSVLYVLQRHIWQVPEMFVEKKGGEYETNLSAYLELDRVQLQNFTMPKKKGVYRIFCVGESSVQGYPFCGDNADSRKAFPYRLQDFLNADFKNIEVINAGLGAASSGVILGVIKQLIRYEPDCIILYAGHNEYVYYFWHPEVLRVSPLIFKIDSLLNNLYSYRLLLKMLNRALPVNKSFQEWKRYNLGSEHLLEISERYKGIVPEKEWNEFVKNELFLCELTFKNNVLEMNEFIKSAGIKFVICTVVSNIKDYARLLSFHSAGLKTKDLKEWEEIDMRARGLLSRGLYIEAIKQLSNLTNIDREYAQSYYLLGKAYYALGNYDSARKNFILAKDHSPVYAPFQMAPSSLNNLIRKIAHVNKIFLIDIEREFYKLKENFGIPGYDLFFENLHPNEEGYRVTAKIIADNIKELEIIPKENYK